MPHRQFDRMPWLIGFAAIILTVITLMLNARGCAERQYGSVQARDDWQQWREVTKRQSGLTGPVQRRERKTTQPPALVLMREHFVACLVFALVMSSAVFFTFMFTVRRVFSNARANNVATPRADNEHGKVT